VTPDETGEAQRRTLMAAERTLLAWLRTGLTVLAVSVGIGKIVPDLVGESNGTAWAVLGGAYAVLGAAVVIYGFWRARKLDHALRAGAWVSMHDNVMWAIGGASVVLGIATASLILIEL
jgi:putative membrane protein